MFSFLFKRSSKAQLPTPETKKVPEKNQSSALASEKEAAIAAAHGLVGNEFAAAEFVLQSRVSEARLLAASHVHSQALLEKIAQAMRETDRRVAKLAQERLDAIKRQQAVAHAAALCIERMRLLEEEPIVLPNHLADVEKSWNALRDVPREQVDEFERGRAVLQQRLIAQTALQRSVIEVRRAAQALSSELDALSPSAPTSSFSMRLATLSGQFTGFCTSSEAQSLPKKLLSEVESELAHARRLLDQLAQRQAAIVAREQALSAWEAEPDAVPDADSLRRALRSLPVLSATDETQFEQRFERLQSRIGKQVRSITPSEPPDSGKYRDALNALERALEEGALQLAADHDKELRSADGLALQWSGDESARLAKARAELNRLKSWARWGGKVSREELIKTAEEMPGKESNPSELAKKIGTLRAQWKSMDAASGSADKEAWRRFDAACTTAYAPVAEHFKTLAAERKENLEKASALIAQVREFVAAEITAVEDDAVDWKKIVAFRSRMVQSWRETGAIDRKEKRNLERQFSEAMDGVSAPLAIVQQEEAKRREELIDQVKRLEPSDRNAMASIRRLQQQWQLQARSMPLDRKAEQALWLRFREACDQYVAHRKAEQQHADTQHAENLRLKNALCDALAAEADGSAESLERLLRDTEQQWNSIGPVARASEQALQERYRKAVAGIRNVLAGLKRDVRRKRLGHLHTRLGLCMALEDAIVSGQPVNLSDLAERWRAVESFSDGFEYALQARFDAALTAARAGDREYSDLLKRNRVELERDLLRMEIKLEIESPPELASERLKLQVESLQGSLKGGRPAADRDELLLRLCRLPASHDQASRTRMERMIHGLGAQE